MSNNLLFELPIWEKRLSVVPDWNHGLLEKSFTEEDKINQQKLMQKIKLSKGLLDATQKG